MNPCACSDLCSGTRHSCCRGGLDRHGRAHIRMELGWTEVIGGVAALCGGLGMVARRGDARRARPARSRAHRAQRGRSDAAVGTVESVRVARDARRSRPRPCGRPAPDRARRRALPHVPRRWHPPRRRTRASPAPALVADSAPEQATSDRPTAGRPRPARADVRPAAMTSRPVAALGGRRQAPATRPGTRCAAHRRGRAVRSRPSRTGPRGAGRRRRRSSPMGRSRRRAPADAGRDRRWPLQCRAASYVLYSNGMIEVETETGVHRFASMEELKAFIDHGEAMSRRAQPAPHGVALASGFG